MAARSDVSSAAVREALVYTGEGAGPRSAKHALMALQRALGPTVQARFIDTQELLAGAWAERAVLLVMPGGADLPYCKHLNGRGNRLIRSFVEAGGSYLGICAGAYYACGRVEFEPGSALEVVGDRELRFFPGKARGAAYPGFDYRNENGATAAPLRFCLPSRPAGPPASTSASTSAPTSTPSASPSASPRYTGTNTGNGNGSPSRPTAAASSQPAHATPSSEGPRLRVADVAGAAAAWDPALKGRQGWVYCRDYSNGGPVFVPPGRQPPSASPHASGPATTTTAAGAGAGGAGAGSGGGGVQAWHDGAEAGATAAVAAAAAGAAAAGPGVEVLAVYPGLGDAVAAVRCRVGRGVAVLTGTHPELPAEDLIAAGAAIAPPPPHAHAHASAHAADASLHARSPGDGNGNGNGNGNGKFGAGSAAVAQHGAHSTQHGVAAAHSTRHAAGSWQARQAAEAQHLSDLGAELAAWEAQRRGLWAALLLACAGAAFHAEGAEGVEGRGGLAAARSGGQDVGHGDVGAQGAGEEARAGLVKAVALVGV